MARITAALLPPEQEDAWMALWRRLDGPLACHLGFLGAAAYGSGEPVAVGLFDKSDVLIGGTTFVERKLRGVWSWYHPVPASFGGLMIDGERLGKESTRRDVLNAVGTLVKKRVKGAMLILPGNQLDARGLVQNGWGTRFFYNYESTLEGANALESKAENSVRRQAEKARESGLRFVSGVEWLTKLKTLHESTRRRQGIADFVPFAAYEMMAREGSSGKWEDLGAEVGGITDPSGEQLLAGGIFLKQRERLFYTLGAATLEGEYGRAGAATLLHLEMTNRFIEQVGGPIIYDWVGANTPSVAQFKSKFRPELQVYCQAVWRSRFVGRLAFHW